MEHVIKKVVQRCVHVLTWRQLQKKKVQVRIHGIVVRTAARRGIKVEAPFNIEVSK